MARYLINVPDHARLEAFMLLHRSIERGYPLPSAFAINNNHYHMHATKTGISMRCYVVEPTEVPTND